MGWRRRVGMIVGIVVAVSCGSIVHAAQNVTTGLSGAMPTHAADQIFWGLAASYMLQQLKRTSWFPWLTEQTSSRVKTCWGFIVAVGTAAGVHLAVTGSMLDGGGATITISGLSLDAMKDVAWQWVSQQAWYDAVVRRR